MYNEITANKRKTIFLISIFVVVILGVGLGFSLATGEDPIGILIIAAIISIVMSLFGYFKGDKVALASSGAKPISRSDNAYVHRMVENLCITAGIKTIPKLYIIHDPAINAFATGRDPEHSSIAVTTGAIEKLENEELEGVLAHELSHVKNYDIRVMTIVIVLVGVISLVADIFVRGMIFGGGRSRGGKKGGGNAIFMIIGLVLIILSPIIAKLIQLAVSRRREYLADASGSLLTRYPEGLARALEKIRDYNEPMERANHATAHLYLESPFRKKTKSKTSLFDTHPPINERIAKLRGMT